MGAEQVRVGDLVLRDPDNPELGFKLDPQAREPIQELGGLPIRMSLTDGLPIIGEAPEETSGIGWPE